MNQLYKRNPHFGSLKSLVDNLQNISVPVRYIESLNPKAMAAINKIVEQSRILEDLNQTEQLFIGQNKPEGLPVPTKMRIQPMPRAAVEAVIGTATRRHAAVGMPKLSEKQFLEILDLIFTTDRSIKEISDAYEVDSSFLYRVRNSQYDKLSPFYKALSEAYLANLEKTKGAASNDKSRVSNRQSMVVDGTVQSNNGRLAGVSSGCN
jgi:hypothetical protein